MKKAIEIFLGIYFAITAIIEIFFFIDILRYKPCPHGYRSRFICPTCYYEDRK